LRLSFRGVARFIALSFVLHDSSAAAGEGARSIVSSTYPLAVEIGLGVLKSSGIDIAAAVAPGLAPGAVDGHNSSIRGGYFFVIRLTSGEIGAVNGRETAPAAATREIDLRNGKADTKLSQTDGGAALVGLPPPSSGRGHVAQILNILENFEVAAPTETGARPT